MKGSFISYVRKIFRKTNIFYPLIRTSYVFYVLWILRLMLQKEKEQQISFYWRPETLVPQFLQYLHSEVLLINISINEISPSFGSESLLVLHHIFSKMFELPKSPDVKWRCSIVFFDVVVVLVLDSDNHYHNDNNDQNELALFPYGRKARSSLY